MARGGESTTRLGRRAEREAATFLKRRGYRILERNYRARAGEIDIIARDGSTLCFVEIRSRRDAAHGDPLETVDRRKQGRLLAAARIYLADRRVPPDQEVRFDVVGVVYQPELRIQLVRGAFDATGG